MKSADADRRLAVYGTLAPGRPNHHHLADLGGTWTPGIVLDSDAPDVAVQVFTSDDLPAHWARLDVFEGEGYARVRVEVTTADGVIEASNYVLTD